MPARSHGEYGTRLYSVWLMMKQRCTNPHHKSYKNYGAKGISVCQEWQTYTNFRDWARAAGYKSGLTIERKNGLKGYSPENCGWVTKAVQNRNTSQNVRITAFGETKIQEDWVNDPRFLTSTRTFRRRLQRGWTTEQAMMTSSR